MLVLVVAFIIVGWWLGDNGKKQAVEDKNSRKNHGISTRQNTQQDRTTRKNKRKNNNKIKVTIRKKIGIGIGIEIDIEIGVRIRIRMRIRIRIRIRIKNEAAKVAKSDRKSTTVVKEKTQDKRRQRGS